MKKLSVILFLLYIFIAGCNTTNPNLTPIDNTTIYQTDNINKSEVDSPDDNNTHH